MKKYISIGIVVLVVLGLAYYLFSISPQTTVSSNYNSALSLDNVEKITEIPPFDPAVDRYQGNPNAKNVFIEYADYQCPGCAAYSSVLKEVPNQFEDTVFVFRYFPLIQIHRNATVAALAAEAAGAQGKYWEMHDILFDKQTEWENMSDPIETFAGYAQSVGVSNIDEFKSDIISKKYLAPIQKGFGEAMGLNLPGTPSMSYNGHILQSDSLEGLKKQAEAFKK